MASLSERTRGKQENNQLRISQCRLTAGCDPKGGRKHTREMREKKTLKGNLYPLANWGPKCPSFAVLSQIRCLSLICPLHPPAPGLLWLTLRLKPLLNLLIVYFVKLW